MDQSNHPEKWLWLALLGLILIAVPKSALATSLEQQIVLTDEAPYFSPRRLIVKKQTRVTWENRGPALTHSILIVTDQTTARSGPIAPGMSWSYEFQSDAVVRTNCEIHPYMYGIVIVGEPPSSMIAAVDAPKPAVAETGVVALPITEYAIPVDKAVPGILAVAADDSIWMTLGGGGWGNINFPPLSKVARLSPGGELTILSTPSDASGPSGIAIDRSGSVFVTELMAGKIAVLEPGKDNFVEFSIPTETAWPTGLAVDASGSLWFSETKGGKLGRLSATRTVSDALLPTADAHPTGLAVDAIGNVWISERDAGKVACRTSDGRFIEYALPTPQAKPSGITVDRSGRVFVSEREGNAVAMITGGLVREFPLPHPHSGPFFPTVDSTGLVWFSEVYANRIGVLFPNSGRIVEIAIPTPDSWPGGLAFDTQGNLWFTEQLGNKVAMLESPLKSLRAALHAEGAQVGTLESASRP